MTILTVLQPLQKKLGKRKTMSGMLGEKSHRLLKHLCTCEFGRLLWGGLFPPGIKYPGQQGQ